jgi:OmpA-OmpF porin, OOP family
MRVALFAALACACVALPAQSQDRGAYLGGGLGQTRMTDWCDDTSGGTTTGAFAPLPLFSCEDTDTGWKVFGGYQFNRYISVEATYINWGKVSATFGASGQRELTAKQQSWGAAALGSLPLGESFALLAKLGTLVTKQNVDVQNEPGAETEIHYGLGARYRFVENGAVRVEWEATSELKLQMISASLEVRF